MTKTPIESLLHNVQTRPQSTAFIFHEEAWSYERIASEAARLARALAAHGVRAGDRVALHMFNRPEMIIAYYACFQLGAIAAPLRTAFTTAELASLVQRLTPTVYLGELDLYYSVAAIDAAILPRDKRFVVGAASGSVDPQPWEALFDGQKSSELSIAPDIHRSAVVINTSGTTGQPKFVAHSAATLGETAELIARHWGVLAKDVIVLPLALAHMAGLATSLAYIHLGTPFILVESFDPDVVLDAFERYGCTVYIGFPTHYAQMLARQRVLPRNLSSLRLCLTGGDVCPVELQEQVFWTFNAPLYNVWAASEVLGSLTYGLKSGPVSRVVNAAQIRLVDEIGAEVPSGEVGELLIRGSNVFCGYWNDMPSTEQSLTSGWYHTGDLMRRDSAGDLWFVSRKKDIIIRGGTNISPIEVEEALVASHSAVKEAVVVGVPDAVLGQRIFGFVILADSAGETVVSEILENVGVRLAAYKIPEDLKVIDKLPLTALGKIDRKKLSQAASDLLEAGQLQMRDASSSYSKGWQNRAVAQSR
ncbi:long-chain acyl-CoA synthetase [Nitrobacteraceae bacterium AZCC 1564]